MSIRGLPGALLMVALLAIALSLAGCANPAPKLSYEARVLTHTTLQGGRQIARESIAELASRTNTAPYSMGICR